MQTCFQNQQVWPCAVLKYYASWGCAVRWPGFNCPWDTLIFTWLTVTLCRAGPAGGGITLVGTWKALAARWTVKAKSVCMLQTTHASMHVFAVQIQHYLLLFQSCGPKHKSTCSLTCWCLWILGIIPSEGWTEIYYSLCENDQSVSARVQTASSSCQVLQHPLSLYFEGYCCDKARSIQKRFTL